MIYTITLNPALDRTIEVDGLVADDANRILHEERYAGGKGIDCSRVIEELGAYDPHAKNEEKVTLNRERVSHWLRAGAKPSATVGRLLAHVGIDGKGNEVAPKPWTKKRTPPPAAKTVEPEPTEAPAEPEQGEAPEAKEASAQ